MTVQAMTAAEVFEYILTQKELCIVDVRDEKAYADWHIAGTSITSCNIAYFDFLEDAAQHLVHIPGDQPVLVVCAQEGASQFVAQKLAEYGFATYYLEGGMRSWSEYLYHRRIYTDDSVTVYQVIRVGKGCLSYVLISGTEMAVLDPFRFIAFYEQLARDYQVQITNILDTHLHADHVSGGRDLAQKTGARYYLMQSEGAVFDFEPLENHEQINFADVQLEVLALKTPGHTPGSVSFLVNQRLLFSGDTLFISGLGRPDLGDKVSEWALDLFETISGKLANLADEVLILPAHFADFEQEINAEGYIGERFGLIRQRNTHLFTMKKEQFITRVAQATDFVKPPNFEEIVAINRGLQEMDEEELSELEIGPNHCALQS